MATVTIPIGRPFTMVTDVVYALPGRTLKIYDEGAGTVQTSNDGVTWAALSGNDVQSTFLRSNGGDSVVVIK